MKRVSVLGALGVLSYLVLVPAAGSLAVTAGARAAGPAVYHGTAGHAVRLTLSTSGLKGLHAVKSRLGTAGIRRVVPFRSSAGAFPASRIGHAQAAMIRASAPIAASTRGDTGASVVHGFNGISDLISEHGNGFSVTPPDQGLCVGRLPALTGKTDLVIEAVNSEVGVTTTNGTLLEPYVTLATAFQDPYVFSDPRCLYDPSTHSFYLTVISFPGGGADTAVDVAVLNAGGLATYQFDTSVGGNCLGDQPKVGFDNNALIVSTDEYCGSSQTEQGALVIAISKSQLAAENSTVNELTFHPVALAGIPVTGLDPAINTGTGTGYLVNSFPYDANGNINAISNSLGLWSLEHDSAVTTGHGVPELTGQVIRSENYAFPVPAASTGDGSLTAGITSEALLNPDDSRISGPVEVTRSGGHAQLWTALDAGVAISGDPTARDGAAWFRIDTGKQRVATQGYVAAKGAYLLYPALLAPPHGPAVMVFTLTSSTINPSAAFTTLGSKKISTVAPGAGPHLSFSDVTDIPRWGDYSFAALDPNGKGVWLATEYIPPAPRIPATTGGRSCSRCPSRPILVVR